MSWLLSLHKTGRDRAGVIERTRLVSCPPMGGADLRDLLETRDPRVRDDLRRVLIRDQADRDANSSMLMRHRDQNGQDWADIIDF